MRKINCPKACGKCCEVIALSFPKKEFHKKEDHRFLIKHWHRISKKKALKLNPNLKDRIQGRYLYTCDCFDKETRLCSVYDKRPRVCKYYPFYGDTVVSISSLLSDCYWANQIMKGENNGRIITKAW